MSLNQLICSCLRTATSHSEQGKSASIVPQKGENILLFVTDHPFVQRELKISRVCDAVFLYFKQRCRPTLIFVELKGKNIQDAADQIQSTIEGVRRLINTEIIPSFPLPLDIRAVVVRTGATPHNKSEVLEKFFKATGVTLRLEREQVDLRKMLSAR